MNIKNVISVGFRNAIANVKFLILLWMTNTIMSLVIVIPIYALLIDNLQHSLVSGKLAMQFDLIWYMQFMSLYKSTIRHLPLLLYGIVGMYIIVQTFYSGGLISIFNNPQKNHISDFFYGGVKYWYRFVKVLSVTLLFVVFAFMINNLLGDLIEWIFRERDYQLVEFILRSLRYLLLIFLIGIVLLISDYSKVVIGISDNTKIFRSIFEAIYFIKDNFFVVFVVFLIVSVMGAVGAIVYNIIDIFVPTEPFAFLFLTFILQQFLIIFRLLIRMLFVTTEVNLFKDISAKVIEAEVKESNIGVK
jgi:hypothetical protein